MSKPILCLDFDGVIHSYATGWHGPEVIPDQPVPGAMEFIAQAVNHFTVAIFSSRTRQEGGLAAMQRYIKEHLVVAHQGDGLDIFDLLTWPEEKPAAFVTIDDRAITFEGTWPAIDTLLAFKPWNKRS